MVNPSLGRLRPSRLSGDEAFFGAGGIADFKVLDFWRWSISDLILNTTRGVLAEYIVAKALGVPTGGVRDPWRSYDLECSGVRVEVKSAAYIQSWAQDRFSDITFTVGRRLGWDPDTNRMDADPRRHANVYVFALLAHREQATINPLDLSQWRFWSVRTETLDERLGNQDSISLSSLEQLAGDPVEFSGLREEVNLAAGRKPPAGT